MRTPFSHLPGDVLEHIAYRVALLDLLGPPSHLVSLLATNSRVYHALSIAFNPHLYSRIFRAKFDYRAPARRLTEQSTLAPALANQLVRYCETLKHIRHGYARTPSDSSIILDLYRAFALCSENDGRNAEQLQWAGLSTFIERYVFDRLWQGRESCYNWPLESGENAFALWLYWFTLTPHKLASHTEEQRACLQTFIRPYAVYNFRYPPFLAPDNHFCFPLVGSPELYNNHSTETPHGYYPQYREPQYVKHSFVHYDEHISIAEPPIGLAAKLLYVALLEHQPQDYPAPSLVPEDRAEADEIGAGGPTLADYYEFGNLRAALPPERGDWDWRTLLSQADGVKEDSRSWDIKLRSLSARQENDWERWRGCYDPWNGNVIARGATFTLGSLNGLWGGRYLDPSIDDYLLAMNSSVFVPELEQPQTTVASNPLFFKLREHHCISPARPLPLWEALNDPFDEGIMNAYCPRDFPHAYSVIHRNGRLNIRKRGRPEEFVYETYVRGKENSHNEDTCEICTASRLKQQEQRMASLAVTPSSDGDAEMLDYDDTDTTMYDSSTDDDDEMLDANHVVRTRTIVQTALGQGTDLEALIDRVAHEADDNDQDDDGASMYPMSPSEQSDNCSVVSRTCSGVMDIIVTGETPRKHALAWDDFHIYGRVRAWDGLIVLVRAPVHTGPLPPINDTYVFRGYLIGGTTLVGAWRHVTDSVHSIPVEGTFVVSRLQDADEDASAVQSARGSPSAEAPSLA
ncbi:hypothetical protein C8Q80DRAFT_1267409 [Daedaleopsis nitida]|nr:hypothetical protein C8Q80DRAFT_1267409 [Daedaleopsis nitida]